jgi:hypothetical protein
MEVRIPGFTLCKEFQATILSLQEECTRVTTESSAPLDDFVHPSMTDEVQIIPDPSIPEFPPCIVVEERPPSSCQIVEEHPSSPKPTKKKDNVFVSTLPRRRTRSTRSTAAAMGWKDMEHAIPILRPLPSITTETATQEPVPSDDMVVTQEPAAQEETVQQDTTIPNLVVTQEPTIQAKTIPQELVRPESTVAPGTSPGCICHTRTSYTNLRGCATCSTFLLKLRRRSRTQQIPGLLNY